MRRSETVAVASLVATTAVWGSTFVVVQNVVEEVPVLDFLGVRFLIATALMLIVRPRCQRTLSPQQRQRGVALGVVLGGGYILQTFGLQHTPAAISGFITGMFVVFTPIVAGIVLKTPIDRWAWIGTGLATLGLALIALQGWSLGLGELLTLGCAVLFALHIVGLGAWATPDAAYGLAVIQLGTVGVACFAAGAVNGVTLPSSGSTWLAVVFLAVFATAIAFFVQTWAQSHITPTRAAIVLTMEPVFAGLFAVFVADETLTPRTLAGAACVLAAMYLVELGPRHARDAQVSRLEA